MGHVGGMGWEKLVRKRPDSSWCRICEENPQALPHGPHSELGTQERFNLGIVNFLST